MYHIYGYVFELTIISTKMSVMV